MTENPYQSPHEPGTPGSADHASRWSRALVGVLLLLGGSYVFELGHVFLSRSGGQPADRLLQTAGVLVTLGGLGMILAACLTGAGLLGPRRKTATPTNPDPGSRS